jgi:hypothetical protein
MSAAVLNGELGCQSGSLSGMLTPYLVFLTDRLGFGKVMLLGKHSYNLVPYRWQLSLLSQGEFVRL